MTVRQFLSSKGFSWKEATRAKGKNGIMNCPFCNDKEKHFAINLSTGAFKCMREGHCGVQGSWYDFQRRFNDSPVPLDDDYAFYKKTEPVVYKKPEIQAFNLSEPALNYLHSRGFKDDVIRQFKLAETGQGTAIAIPYYKNDKIVGVKYRSFLDKKMWNEKETEPVLFNRENCSEAESLIIVEGEFDAISFKHYGLDVVSVPNGTGDVRWIEVEWEWLEQFQKIYLAFDYDTAGQKCAEQIAGRLGRWRCYNVILPEKDANDCLKNGVTKEVIENCIEASIGFTIPNLVDISFFTESITDLFNNPEKMYGLPTAWSGLTAILGGWRTGELTVWSGVNGSGKSTMLNQVMLGLAESSVKSCIASLEMLPERFLWWMVLQKSSDKEIIHKPDEIAKLLNKLKEYIFILNTYGEVAPEELLNACNYSGMKVAL